MKTNLLACTIVAVGLLASPSAFALDCKASVDKAATAVAKATDTMRTIKDTGFKSRVRVLVDDAVMLANSSKRLCGRENATRQTIARAQAQAESAIAWAKASQDLAAAYEAQ